MSFKVRDDLHLARRLYHVLGVCAVIYLYHILTRTQALQALVAVSIAMLIFEVVRFRNATVNRFLIKYFLSPILRKNELRNFSGMTYLILGVLVIVFLFPPALVTMSLLFLAFADPLASIVGILYGKDKIIGNKSLQGAVAAFAVCTVIAFTYLSMLGILQDRLILVSVLAGMIGAVSELIPVGRLDDNFTFPVISASLLWILFSIFGGY